MAPFQLVWVILCGWLQREQEDVIVFLREENRILKARLEGRRLCLEDHERRRLAELGHRLGRQALIRVATLVFEEVHVLLFECPVRTLEGTQHTSHTASADEREIATRLQTFRHEARLRLRFDQLSNVRQNFGEWTVSKDGLLQLEDRLDGKQTRLAFVRSASRCGFCGSLCFVSMN